MKAASLIKTECQQTARGIAVTTADRIPNPLDNTYTSTMGCLNISPAGNPAPNAHRS